MDRLDAMRLFTRIVDRRSFTQAAHDLDIPRSTATQVIRQLEERLRVRLLQRTTRTVRPTLDGEAYYRRCLAILDDVEDAEGAFRGTAPKGQLRIEVQGTLARHFLMPAIPKFLADYPDITVAMSESERWVDVIQEGVDCVLRYGALPDSDLVARRVTMLDRITVAAPDYLNRFGRPSSPDDLAKHHAVGLRSITTGALRSFEFVENGGIRNVQMDGPLSVTGTESFRDGVLLGLGLAQMPIFHIAADLAAGRLARVLADYPVPSAPVSVLYPRNRQLSPRVRLFIDWAVQQFTAPDRA
ncbi:LysR family transcriptional regulator [Sphingomonas sp.]|uniref:LysR family transcriptional regulator n=1 Tax=Sphingomonas sp. TaxID=28214 RepID=UPI0025FC0ECA|nr:LysR family transcriptional regulator [Sphingomonas sp.]